MRKLLFYIAGICLLIGCSKSEQFSGDDLNVTNLNKMNPKSFVAVSDKVCFEGNSYFYCYAPKEGRLVVNPDEWYLPVTATLTRVEGQNYLLTTTEFWTPEVAYRITEWDVKISAGGVVMFSWPQSWFEGVVIHGSENVVGQVLRHTGCIITGPGVNKGTLDYNGNFDGVNFYAATHFTGQQVQVPEMDVYAGINGPAQFVFSMALTRCLVQMINKSFIKMQNYQPSEISFGGLRFKHLKFISLK